jgi:uncharacterized protein YjcR
MDIDLKAVLLQMRITHIMQTANLIDQANTLFNLEESLNSSLLKQKEIDERNVKKSRRKTVSEQQRGFHVGL